MKTKQLILIFVLSIGVLNTHAEVSSTLFQQTIEMLDDTVRGLAPDQIVAEAAQVLKCDESAAKLALVEKKWKLSSLGVAQFLADGKKGVLTEYLKRDLEPNWVEEIKSAGASLSAANEFLDSFQSEIALLTWDKKLDGKNPKGKKKGS
jgi:hypothetical protein